MIPAGLVKSDLPGKKERNAAGPSALKEEGDRVSRKGKKTGKRELAGGRGVASRRSKTISSLGLDVEKKVSRWVGGIGAQGCLLWGEVGGERGERHAVSKCSLGRGRGANCPGRVCSRGLRRGPAGERAPCMVCLVFERRVNRVREGSKGKEY